MNTLIEHLNNWGASAGELAWPLFWQSSLLIGLLLGLEWALRRRVRAAVPYGLWLLVLLKLLLPPSLALPTGLGWWLRPAAATPTTPRSTAVVITYGPAVLSSLPSVAEPVFVQPAPHLSSSAGALVGSAMVSLGFLGWIVVRWRQTTREAQRASEAPEWLEGLLQEARQAMGLRRGVRLRLLDKPVSPAVCGLLWPMILLPRSLVERLSRGQLRAVLLHELAHLRRGDVWANCAQALLQVVYWWHPLLWLANARIRRLREEAVDDAVMVALREEAESYAPTLLEVARLALHRPLASLGLVGILESHSFLRQRIERLLEFRPPRKARLTFASALCVVAFGALALPMGEGPSRSEEAAVTPAGDRRIQGPVLLARQFKVDQPTVLETFQRQSALGHTNGLRPFSDTQQLGFDWFLGDLLRNNGIDPQTFERDLASGSPDALFTLRGILTEPQFRVVLHALGQQNRLAGLTAPSTSIGTSLIPASEVNMNPQALKAPGASTFGSKPMGSSTNAAPPQINIKAKVFDLPGYAAAKVWTSLGVEAGSTHVLTPAKAEALLNLILSDPNTDSPSAPEVTTLSGRQAQIQCTTVQTVETNLNPQAFEPPGVLTSGNPGGLYLTTKVVSGPLLDVLPEVAGDEWSIRLRTVAKMTECIGYDPPLDSRPVDGEGKEQTASRPRPRFRIRSVDTSATVLDGQTLVLGGPNAEDVKMLKDKVPVLGDMPFLGQVFRSQSNAAGNKYLLILVTPTLIDSRGNRLHTQEAVGQARSAITK